MRKSNKVILSVIMLAAISGTKAIGQTASGLPASEQPDTTGLYQYHTNVTHVSWFNRFCNRVFHGNSTHLPRLFPARRTGGFGTTARPLVFVAHS